MKDVDLDQISRSELKQQTPEMRLELLLREWCNRKHGHLGFCKSKSHATEAKEMFPLAKEWLLND